MGRRSVQLLWLVGLVLVAGCAVFPSASPAPPATTSQPVSTPVASDATAAVESALAASGLTVVSTSDVTARVANQSCGPTQPVSVLSIGYGIPGTSAVSSEQPMIEVLIFGSVADRRAYQQRISRDGTTVNGSTCVQINEYAFPPHWSGGGNDLLLVVTEDPTVVVRVAAATALLGPS
jgi:hypothetical protein